MRTIQPAVTFDPQAQRLLDRGLFGVDKNMLVQSLAVTNYDRLGAYWYPFKRIDPHTGSERSI